MAPWGRASFTVVDKGRNKPRSPVALPGLLGWGNSRLTNFGQTGCLLSNPVFLVRCYQRQSVPETSLAILILPHPVVLWSRPASICLVIFYYLVKHVISVTHTLFVHSLPFWKSLIKTCWFYGSGNIMDPADMWCLPRTPSFKFLSLVLFPFISQPSWDT